MQMLLLCPTSKKKLKLRSVNETTALINIYEEEARE